MKIRKYLVLVIFGILLVSCGKSEVILELEEQQIIESINSELYNIQITLLSEGENNNRNEEYLYEWEQYIKENFDINIKINFTINNNSNYMAKYSLEFIRDGLEGLFFVESKMSKEFLEYALYSNLILDVSEYLKSNEYWNQVSPLYKELYAKGGVTFGIPNSITPILYGRLINKEWLSNLNMKLPKNLVELNNLLYKFTYEDPDLNLREDTIGIAFRDAFDFNDVFNAYGCYLDFPYEDSYSSNYWRRRNTSFLRNQKSITSIAYNPMTNQYEDSMFNDDMVNVFEYIRGLVDNNVCTTSINPRENVILVGENDEVTINSGMYYGGLYDNSTTHVFNSIFEGEKGNSVIPISYVDKSLGAYYLSATTKNPKLVVNSFIDTFYQSKEGNFIAANGIETNGEELLVPIVCESLYENHNDQLLSNIKNQNNWYTILPIKQIELKASSVLSTINEDEEYKLIGTNYYGLFNSAFSSLILGEVAIDEIMDNYKTKAKEYGVFDLLYDLNENSN